MRGDYTNDRYIRIYNAASDQWYGVTLQSALYNSGLFG